MTIEFKNPPVVRPPSGGYSHVAVVEAHSKLLVLAGQVGERLDGSFAETVDAQFRQALDNIIGIVALEGGDAGSIVRLTMYFSERPVCGSVAAIMREYFKSALPATTAVFISSLYAPHVKVEVEAIAAV